MLLNYLYAILPLFYLLVEILQTLCIILFLLLLQPKRFRFLFSFASADYFFSTSNFPVVSRKQLGFFFNVEENKLMIVMDNNQR
jgi:hypothetical protein